MAVKLVAIYATPDDPDAFEEHYRKVHVPLVQQVPGLADLRLIRRNKRLLGTADVYLIAEMIFPDQEAFENAMASPENRATGKDLANFAKDKVTLIIAKD